MPDGRLFVETVTKRDIYMQIHEKQRDLEHAQLYVEEAQSAGRHERGAPFCVLNLCHVTHIPEVEVSLANMQTKRRLLICIQ